MTGTPLHVVVLIGSVRDGRFGPTAAEWFTARAHQRTDFTVDVIDLLDHPLPLVMPEPNQQPVPEVAEIHLRLKARLAAADAFVVVTAEYNHTVPAALKNAIDWYFDEWAAKAVAYVSYGGMSGGLRAVEHLRQIFTELHAVSVRESLSFHNPWDTFADGAPRDAEASEDAAKVMLDRLAWWATALREARTRHPFER